jgi:putative transposase
MTLGRSTIQRFLKERGIERAPVRGKTLRWKTFLKAHWGAIAAADFFSVEVPTVGGFVRYLVLFVIDLKTRRVHVAGISSSADGAWMAQSRSKRHRPGGRSASRLCTPHRRPRSTLHLPVSKPSGIHEGRPLAAARQQPNLNAYAERFVRSIKHECLRHIVRLGERHLRNVIHDYVSHYHAERPQQGLGNIIPFPSPVSSAVPSRIRRSPRLGGLLNYYDRLAA